MLFFTKTDLYADTVKKENKAQSCVFAFLCKDTIGSKNVSTHFTASQHFIVGLIALNLP